jgi:hypothetical protein
MFFVLVKRWTSLRRVDVRDGHLVKRGVVLHGRHVVSLDQR